MGYEPRWRRPDERQPPCSAAGHAQEWHGRYAIGLPRRAELAVRHGSDR